MALVFTTIITVSTVMTAPGMTPRFGKRAMARLTTLSKCANASRMSRSAPKKSRAWMRSRRVFLR